MKVPRKQSRKETPRTPQATLIPDQGTIPTNRKTVSRTQVGDGALVLPPESASKTLRAKANGRGRKCVINGDRGAERSVARIDPTVVRTARSSVAKRGENRAPARTFFFFGNAHGEQDKMKKEWYDIPKERSLGWTMRASIWLRQKPLQKRGPGRQVHFGNNREVHALAGQGLPSFEAMKKRKGG